MAIRDLRTFLLHLESRGDLRRVTAEVDPVYEIAEIAQRVVHEGGPALIFENVKGSRFPLAINFLGSFERIEQALGMHPEELGARLLRFAETVNPPRVSSLGAARKIMPRLLAYRPRRQRRAACHDVVEHDPDLTQLPIIHCWPQDGGRFITFPLVMTRHPSTGKRNLGIYRMQLFDRATTGMHWQLHKGGGFHYHAAEKAGHGLPVAVVLGSDPALMLAAMFPLPESFEEVAFAGLISGRATKLSRARTIDLDVPANAEFVLEGEVLPFERRAEGPFGDHFGHYCDVADFPVFRVRTITRRRNAIYPAAVVGKPPQEDRFMGDASQMIMGPMLRLIKPEVRDVWAYYEAGFHNLLVVAMESRYTREPIRTALGILGEGQLGLTKCLVLVDASTDARSFPHVLRAIRDHFDPAENFHLISRAPLDTLDFTSFKMHMGSRMILDATGNRAEYSGGRPLRDAVDPVGAAPALSLPADLRSLAPGILRWRLWEDTLLAVQVDRTAENAGRSAVEKLVACDALAGVRVVAAVSPDVDLQNDVDLIWGVFTRFDPARDLVFTRMSMNGAQPEYRGIMGIDATWKPGYPDAVTMPDDVVRRVDQRWKEYFS